MRPALLFVLVCAPAMAASTSYVQMLEEQSKQWERALPFVERPELGQALTLKKLTRQLIEAIETPQLGEGHKLTTNLLDNLIMRYRHSSPFLQSLDAAVAVPAIENITRIADAIAKKRGFDDSPYSQATATAYKQIYELITKDLADLPLPKDLGAKINALKADIGGVIGAGNSGDSLHTLALGIPLYRKVEALYPDFNDIPADDVAFPVIVQIQGCNEWYGRSFSKFDLISDEELVLLIRALRNDEKLLRTLIEKLEAEPEVREKGTLVPRLIEKLKS